MRLPHILVLSTLPVFFFACSDKQSSGTGGAGGTSSGSGGAQASASVTSSSGTNASSSGQGGSASGSGQGGSAGSSASSGQGGSASSSGQGGSGQGGSASSSGQGGSGQGGSAGSSGQGGGDAGPPAWSCSIPVPVTIQNGFPNDRPWVIWNGSELLVFKFDPLLTPRGLYYSRFSPDGIKLGSDVLIESTASTSFIVAPRAVWTGTESGVAWATRPLSGSGVVRFVRLALDGTPLAPPIDLSPAAGSINDVEMVWTGQAFGVAWLTGTTQAFFTRVDATGVEIGQETSVTGFNGAAGNAMSLVWTGNEFGLAASYYEVHFTRISSDGMQLIQPIPITPGALSASSPELVWTGSQYAIAWFDEGSQPKNVQFMYLAPNGTPIGSPVVVTTAASYSLNNSLSEHSLSLVWNGTEFGMLEFEQRAGDFTHEVYFTRFSAAGVPLAADIKLTDSGTSVVGAVHPQLVWKGDGYVAAWRGNKEPAGWSALMRSICP